MNQQTLASSSSDHSQAAAVAALEAAASVPREVNERLCHLFRASLKMGRIHPLYLPILKYRHSRHAE